MAALLVAMACLVAPQSIHSPADGGQEQWREHVAVPGTWAPDPWEFDPTACGPDGSACSGFSLGNHRAELRVVGASATSSALVATLRWRRRPSPAWNPATPDVADYATVVVTFSSLDDGGKVTSRRPQLVTNFSVINATADAAVLVFQPSLGPGLYSAYYLPYNFSGGSGAYTSVFGPPPHAPTKCAAPSGSVATAWHPNHATASSHSHVTGSSGDSWPANAAWKAADGDLSFASGVDCQHPAPNDACEGWNPFPGPTAGSPEFITFDLQECVQIDGFALWSTGDGVHDAAQMTLQRSDDGVGAWHTVAHFNGSSTAGRQEWRFAPAEARYWRWEILSVCCKVSSYQSFVNETQFHRSSEPLPFASGSVDAWRAQHGLLGSPAAVAAAVASLPSAPTARFTARTEFDMFTEMERMASVGETSALLRSISNRGLLRPYLLFPEQRTFSVRETAGIPLRWILAASQSDITTPTFSASVERDEFFVFQIGVLSTGAAPVTVLRYDVLRKHPPASVLLNCFSLEGVDFHGRSFNQNMTVPARSVGSLWFGVNVSDSLSPGAVEHFGLQLFFADNSSTVVEVRLTVAEGPPLLVHGDHNATRLSRLRWLDSTRWQDTTVSQSYQPVMVTQQPVTGGAVITLLNRRVEVLSSGLLGSVQSNGAELLAAPMGFSLTATSGKVIQVRSSRLELHQHGEGVVSWSSEWSTSTAELSVQCSGVLYYDGFIDYSIAVTNDAAVMQLLGNSRFEVAFKADAIRWLMGFDVMPSGRWNASRPIDWSWSAYADGAEQWLRNLRSSAWLGRPHAGMRVKFKGLEPEWNSPSDLPLLPPSPWAGCHGKPPATGDPAAYKANCTGRVSVMEQGGVVTLSSSSGPITLAATSSTVFPMDILVTPMRPVNLTRHMETRYAHLFGNVQTKAPAAGNPSGTLGGLVDLIASLNATYAILHQGTSLNTYINEPILEERLPALETFVRLCHAAGIKVKLYFTTRELTNRAPELFAIKSLPNHEVITTGPGGGGAWLQEHLGHDYLVGWSSVNYVSQENGSFFGLDPNLKGVRADEAVQDSGSGRWSNWYVEGVHYSVSEWPGSDGLYCDGIAFDRGTLERVRKSMEAAKGDDVRIDLHASNGGGCDSGGWGSPALQYAQHLSWVDSLWFGEGFDYWGQSADWWLLEASGIPFGLTGEMIREIAVGPNGGQNTACAGYFADPNRWLGAVFGMTARMCVPNLATDPGIEEVLPIQNYWRAVGLGRRDMVGWWDDHPLVATDDDQVKATAFVLPPRVDGAGNAEGLPSMVIALGNFRNHTVQVGLSGAVLAGRQLRAVAIEGFQAELAPFVASSGTLTIVAKRGWLLETVEPGGGGL